MNLNRAIFLALSLLWMGSVCLDLAAKEKIVSDDSVYDHVKRRLANDPDVKGGAMEIEVKQGVVTLRGTVDTDKQKQKAEKLARKVSGVKQVINEIKLSGK
jgi:osmotically-inducible protein OsmY